MLAQRVRQRDAVASLSCAQLVLVAHRAGGRRRAEERAPEARALLVGPVDEPHRHRRRALGGDPPQHLDAGHDVQAAVEPAAVRDRVDVAADQQRALGGAPQREPLVARLVDLLDRAGLRDLAAEELARLLPGLRPGDPLRAVLVAGERRSSWSSATVRAGSSAIAAILSTSVDRDKNWRVVNAAVAAPLPRRAARARRSCGRSGARPRGRRRRRCSSALWELYRWIWTTAGWTWPFVVDDTSMPHVWTILKAFGQPAQVNQPALDHDPPPQGRSSRRRRRRPGSRSAPSIGFALGGRARPLAPAAARLPAVHRREPDDPDPRDRADGRRLGQPEAAGARCRAGARSR